MGLARHHELHAPCAFASVFHRAFKFRRRGLGVAERKLRDRDQPPAAVRAPIDDPAVVRAAHRLGVISIVAFGFPVKPDSRINDCGAQSLKVEPLDALAGVHRTQGKVLSVGAHAEQFALFARHPAHYGITENAAPRDLRGPSLDLQVITLVVSFHTDRHGFVLRLRILIPQVRRFHNMAVRVHGAGILELVEFFFHSGHLGCLNTG